MPRETFQVDTHLFRELGELLVGRNSTALVELIKNAYDADATRITIDGKQLSNPRKGRITISDNGIGMSPEHFQKGFLTIAGRLKDTTQRKSPMYHRRYTGAKGIGRLAAHKLARFIEIVSCPDKKYVKPGDEILTASIDWDIIESKTLFSEIAETDAVELRTTLKGTKAKPGTTIKLKRLRKKWTSTELVQFQAEVESYRPPDAIKVVPRNLVTSPLLFTEPLIADSDTKDPGITFDLTGDFSTGDDFWPQVAQSSHWLVEVDASDKRKKVSVRITPTKIGKKEFPDAAVTDFRIDRANYNRGPEFQSRFFIREGGTGNRAFKQWISRSFGIRVYSEGFRVLPYGEPGNDWLSLDADYKTRPKTLSYLESQGFESKSEDENEGLVILGNRGYFGAVFLTLGGAPDLKMLINREGFVSDPTFDQITELMRTAIYLSVRVRAAAKRNIREQRRLDREPKQPAREELRQAVDTSVARAAEYASEARKLAASGDMKGAEKKIVLAASQFSKSSEIHGRLMSEGSTLRVLASVGTQMAAFVHEINAILGMARALESAVESITKTQQLTLDQKRKLRQMHSAIEDLRRGIERQASYLTDVVSPDARRRRSRQNLADRFEAGIRLVAASASRQNVEILNRIPEELRSPPMFPAELTVVFSNVLTNAVKAAQKNGKVRATARSTEDGRLRLIIQNTGKAVNLKNSERWFHPFESTTTKTDPVLGQGMGMGLTITRNLLEEYGATISFREPTSGFASAIEIIFP